MRRRGRSRSGPRSSRARPARGTADSSVPGAPRRIARARGAGESRTSPSSGLYGARTVRRAHSGHELIVDLGRRANRQPVLLPRREAAVRSVAREKPSSCSRAAARLVEYPCAQTRTSCWSRPTMCGLWVRVGVRVDAPLEHGERDVQRSGDDAVPNARDASACRSGVLPCVAQRSLPRARAGRACSAHRATVRRVVRTCRQAWVWRQSSQAPRRTTSCAATTYPRPSATRAIADSSVGVFERLDLPAVVADEVVMMIAAGVGRLEARDSVPEVDSLDEARGRPCRRARGRRSRSRPERRARGRDRGSRGPKGSSPARRGARRRAVERRRCGRWPLAGVRAPSRSRS